MPISDLILYEPMVLLTASASSPSGLQPVASTNQISFGTVYKIYDTCTRLLAGNSILFDQRDAYLVNDSGITYYLIDEKKVMATDSYAP